MIHIQKLGGIAACANGIVGMATVVTVVFGIGISTIADPNQLVNLAIHTPAPLLIEDGLKFVSAGISSVLIVALASYLRRDTSALLSAATGFGLLSVLCLLANATLSVYAIFQATGNNNAIALDSFNRMIGILAIATISLEGLWFLLISWTALQQQQLPRTLCYLGFGIGVLSLVPPLGLVGLVLGMVWSGWIGQVLLTHQPAKPESA
jgi:nicotinamide riboside transporter PnuC